MQWLDRAGLFLELVAFLLAAPEILGQTKMVRLHRAVSRGMTVASTFPVVFGTVLVASALIMRLAVLESGSLRIGLWVGGSAMLTLGGTCLFAGKRLWSRLVRHLEDDESLRSNFLVMGAICYGLGFLCQFSTTF